MKYDVIGFGREELEKYLKILGVEADIKLGLFENFGEFVEVNDTMRDDAYIISVKDNKGFIAGSNERSVLFGIYRLLEEWGITWVRPGPNGTKYPEKCVAIDLDIREAASKRNRIMCIEGAVSIENALDMIDWMTKVGFNGYYIQFTNGYVFFDRWYNHMRNPYKKGTEIPQELATEYVEKMTYEIKRRGLLLHRMGHGWHCRAFGVPDAGWYQYDEKDIPKEYVEICAMVDGERKCWNNRPLQTQLCYSNPYVIEKMTDEVLNYAIDHPETDAIYFWLGDGGQFCECEECSKLSKTDNYINMVDVITRKFKEHNIKSQVIFSGVARGVPEKKWIENTENCMLMFAPINRTMAYTFPENYNYDTTMPNYDLKKNERPKTSAEYFSFLYHWKKVYGGEVIDFDYHLMWDFMLDAGGEGIARVINTDIKNCDNLGVNGYISCQLQRNAFPSSIGMTSIAKTMWNSNTDFEAMRRKLYAATFGEDAVDKLCEYFSTLSDCFKMGVIRAQVPYNSEEVKADMKRAKKTMDDFGTVIDAHLDVNDPCQKDSWRYLAIHRVMYSLIAESIYERLCGNYEKANELKNQATNYSFAHEDETQPVLDTMFFDRMMNERINLANPEMDPPPLF